METVKWYKYGVFWRRGDGDDDHSSQDRDDGVIDFITNALTKYRKDGDYSADAVQCFKESALLLMGHRRFPDEFKSEYDVKIWWMYYIRRPFRKLMVKFKIPLVPMFRSQHDMTRDPYKAFGCMYAFLYRMQKDELSRLSLTIYFNLVSIPFRLRRGGIQKWWNRFKRDGRDHFVKRLGNWEALGTHDWYEANYEDNFYNDTP